MLCKGGSGIREDSPDPQKSADCKRGQRKGATSKSVKNYQKVFRHFSTIFAHGKKTQKNPRAHKNKIGTSPPKKKPKYPPPLKTRILWTWFFSCRTDAEILGAHKIGAATSGPRIADKNFTDTRIFLKNVKNRPKMSKIFSTIFARHQSSGPFLGLQDTKEYLNQRGT